MPQLVLVQPEIPPNTGNLIRLAAVTGMHLHLVRPLGFALDDRSVQRAGLDYHDMANVSVHHSWQAFSDSCAPAARRFAVTTHGTTRYTDVVYQSDDVLVFGGETHGLPPEIEARFAPATLLRLPMLPSRRSLNLANAVSIVAYEAWRQLGFVGGI
jgi:tRNA (cytidine/uridine-2'-O-)-methyltransferase